MSSELRAKIANTIQECHRKGIAHYGEIAEHILALEGYIDRTPPATAKLPEGVEIVKSGTERSATVWNVRHGVQYLNTMHGWGGYYRRTDFMDDATALTAALSAPPVPGEKPTPDADVQAVSAALELVREHTARIAELEAENARLRAQYDMVEQERTRLMLGQQVPYTPAEKPDARTVAPNGRAMVEWRRVDDAHVIGRDDSCHWWYWLYGEMRWEPCRLDPELFKPCTFDGTPITETKPDPRKVAPNGRAMARYELCGPNREYNMHGIDDEGHDWAWAHEGMWIEPFPACMDSRRTPCTFDGTPITETKPDPLARAVTVGEMLRLADNLKKGDLYFLCNHIRRVFTPPQGASHVE